MSTKRYESTGEIIGQFLPKIYTRRITLESKGNNPKSGETVVTIDYQIKDILDQNGLGIITKTRKQVIESGRLAEEDMQDDILKALKVVVIAIEGKTNAENLASQMYNLASLSFTEGKTFEQALETVVNTRKRFGQKIAKAVKLARPSPIGFEFRNTIYQQFDNNNNVINIIPGEHTFFLENQEWDNLKNFSIICFSYFDFESLGLTTDNFSEEEARRLSYTIGDLTLDAVTRGGRIVSTANIYKVSETGQPYYGPVHYHAIGNPGPDDYVGYMAGYAGSDMGPKLNKVQVPITKIQDFRAMQRSKMVNYQPDQLEYFNNRTPNIEYLDNGNKNYFRLHDVVVNYDKEEAETNIEFTVNMFDIFKRNSRYYNLVKNVPGLLFASPVSLMKILSMRVVRRRMTTNLSTNNKLGAKKRRIFMPESEDEHLVISTSDGGSLVPEVLSVEDEYYGAIRQSGRTYGTRSFEVSDYEIASLHGTNGIYQYGVEMVVSDNTKSFILQVLERARRSITQLKLYSQESKIPVFDTYNVRRTGEGILTGFSEDPSYSEAITQTGNFDPKTRLFTSQFVTNSKNKYNFREYVDNFKNLLYYSFGRSNIKRTRRSIDPTNEQLEDQINSPVSALESLNNDGFLPSPESIAETELYNMINPSNANPESIDSFISSFEDLVLEMEQFFGLGYSPVMSSEGSGYTSKGDYSFTVKRWFDSSVHGVDMDTMVYLEPFVDEVSFDYDIANPVATGLRTTLLDILSSRLQQEASLFESAASNPAVFSPRALNIGNWVVCFSRDYEKKKKDQIEKNLKETQQKQKSSASRKRTRPFTRVGKGLSSKWERKIKRLKRKKIVYMDPSSKEDTNAVSNFVTGLKSLSNVRGPTAPISFLRGLDTLRPASFFQNIRSMNDFLANNIINYADLVDSTTLLSPERERRFPQDANECGLIDNTPKSFRVPIITDYLDQEDLFIGFGSAQSDSLPPSILTVLPPIDNIVTVTRPPQSDIGEAPPILPAIPSLPDLPPTLPIAEVIPQLGSSLFPTGGIFDDAMVFPANSATGKIPTFGEVASGGGLVSGKLDLVPTKTFFGSSMKPSTAAPSSSPMPALSVPLSTPAPSYSTMKVGGASPLSAGTSGNSATSVTSVPQSTPATPAVTSPSVVASPPSTMSNTFSGGSFIGGSMGAGGGFSGAFGGFGGY